MAYGNYLQGSIDSSNNAYNVLLSGAHSGYTSSGLNIGGDTSTMYGVKLSTDSTNNAYLDVRADISNKLALRYKDNSSGTVSSMLDLVNDSALSSTSSYGASVNGRVKASSYYVGSIDTRAPLNTGVYQGYDGNVGYFNINKGSGSGGFSFKTYNSDGSLLQSNLNLLASGIIQASYYTATGNAADFETIAVSGFDISGNIVRSYTANSRFRALESRLTAVEGDLTGGVPTKVNEIVSRLNGLNFFSQNIATIAVFNPSNPSPAAYSGVQAPFAPTNVVATPSYTSVSVSFTSSVNATSYTVTSSPSGIISSGTISPIIVSGLSSNTSYTFTMTASNGGGTSSSSTVSSAVTTLNPTYTYYDVPSTGGTLTFQSDVSLEIFMIGGGGGGGSIHAGGGGAGAYYYTNGTYQSVSAGTTLSVTIGSGGTGSVGTTSTNSTATNGGDTFIQVNGSDLLRVKGGGAGSSYMNGTTQAASGGCGGGGNSYNTTNNNYGIILGGIASNGGTNGIGNNGGNGNASMSSNILSAGGGGGIGGVGQNGVYGKGGNGGTALAISITGISLVFGGGGGGGMWDAFTTTGPGIGGGVTINGTFVQVGGSGSLCTVESQLVVGGVGVANTGSGGGGGGSYSGKGGNGSAGRCIIKIMNYGVSATTSLQAYIL